MSQGRDTPGSAYHPGVGTAKRISLSVYAIGPCARLARWTGGAPESEARGGSTPLAICTTSEIHSVVVHRRVIPGGCTTSECKLCRGAPWGNSGRLRLPHLPRIYIGERIVG